MKKRFVKCSIDGREYSILEYWMIGAVRTRIQFSKMTPTEATADAIKTWDELYRIEKERDGSVSPGSQARGN